MATIDSSEILLLEPDRSAVVVAAIRNVMIQVWHGEPTVLIVQRIRDHMQAMCERYPDGFALIHVFYASAPPFPPRDVLVELKAMAKMKFASLRAQAAVIEYKNFTATALRAFLTTAGRVSPQWRGLAFFSTVEDAAAWALTELGPAMGALRVAEVSQAIAVVREQRG